MNRSNSSVRLGWKIFTRPTTNKVIVEYLNGIGTLAGFALGELPLEPVAPDLIHEAVHNICLSYQVPTCIAMIDLCATEKMAGQPVEDLTEGFDPATRKAIALHHLLKPLYEGMALFAEFDLEPSHPEVAHSALALLVRLTMWQELKRRGVWDRQFDLRISQRLLKMRGTAEFIKRKERILSSALNDPAGYLAGYIYVRSGYRIFAESNVALSDDSDSFLALAQEFFLGDWTLIEILLDDDRPVEAIRHYMHERKLAFYSSLADSDATSSWIASRKDGVSVWFKERQGYELLQTTKPLPDNPGAAAFLGLRQRAESANGGSLPPRHVFHVVTSFVVADEDIEANGWQRDPSIHAGPEGFLKVGDPLSIVWDAVSNQLICFGHSDGETRVFYSDPVAGVEGPHLAADVLSRLWTHSDDQATLQEASSAILGDLEFTTFAQVRRQDIWIEYFILGSLWLDNEKLAEVRDAMLRDGFRGVLSMREVRLLALVSCVAQTRLPIQRVVDLNAVAKYFGHESLLDDCKLLQRKLENLGVRAIKTGESEGLNYVWCAV